MSPWHTATENSRGQGKGAGSPSTGPHDVWSGSGNQKSLSLSWSLVGLGQFLLMDRYLSGRKRMRGNSICSLKNHVLPVPLIHMGGPQASLQGQSW